jgi:hypothetical protein
VEALKAILIYNKVAIGEDYLTWHENPLPIKEDPPSKYEIIAGGTLESYEGVYKDADERAEFREFKKDYPEIFSLLEAELKQHIPAAAKLKPTQYFKEFITWGELADLGLYNYKRLTKVNNHDIVDLWAQQGKGSTQDRKRMIARGVAILQEPEDEAAAEEYSGNYPRSFYGNLLAISKDGSTPGEIKNLYEKLMKPALRYLFAFNILLEALGEAYDIEDIDTAKEPLRWFETQLAAYNGLIYVLYYQLDAETDDQLKEKRAVLKALFPPVDVEALKPKPADKEALIAKLKKIGYGDEARQELKNFDGLIAELTPGKGADVWTTRKY